MHQKKINIRHTLLFAALAAVAPAQAVEIIIAADKAKTQPPPAQYTLQYQGRTLGRFADLNILQPRNNDELANLLFFEGIIDPQLASWLHPKQQILQAILSDDWLRWQRGDAANWRGLTLDQMADCDNNFFRPEIDDEVLVLFAHGDMRQPIVIGALYNGKDAPPQTERDGDKEKNQSQYLDEIEIEAKLQFYSDQSLHDPADCSGAE